MMITGAGKGAHDVEEVVVGNDHNDNSFRGCFEHTLDGKGRVSLPAPFRQALFLLPEPTVILTNFICDGARCLDGFSKAGWIEFENKLRGRSRFDPQLRKLEHYYLARAVECPVDASGRINIPQHLRAYAALDKQIVFASALSGFRIWDKRVWDLIFKEAEAALLGDPSLFVGVDV